MADIDWKSGLVHKVVCAIVIERDGRFLVTELDGAGREFDVEGKWTNPGGWMLRGERPHDTIERAMAERLNTEVKLTGLVGIYQHCDAHKGYDLIKLVFRAELIGSEPSVGKGVKDLEWLDINDLKYMETEGKLLDPYVFKAIEDYLEKDNYPLEIIHSFV